MTAKTLQDIINIDSSKISISDFIDFLKNVDMEFPTPSANKEYILYAGKIARIGCASAHRRGNICFLSMVRQGTPVTPKSETQHEVFGGLL